MLQTKGRRTDGQTDEQIGRRTDRQTDRQMGKQTDRGRQADGWTDGQADKRMGRVERLTDRCIGVWIDRQTV